VFQGRLRGQVLAWAALVSITFNPIPFALSPNARSWGLATLSDVHAIFIGMMIVILAWDIARRRLRPYIVAALLFAVWTFGTWPPWSTKPLHIPPLWLTQVVLVGAGLVMVVEPLWAAMRKGVETGMPSEMAHEMVVAQAANGTAL